MVTFNTNLMANNALRSLTLSKSQSSTSAIRFAIGLRINSAKDDVAGLAISQRLLAEIGGLELAARYANDGIAMLQTVDAELEQSSNILLRMRDLAVQAKLARLIVTDHIKNETYVAAILHELGKLLITAYLPQQYETIKASLQADNGLDITELERNVLRCTHTELTTYQLGIFGRDPMQPINGQQIPDQLSYLSELATTLDLANWRQQAYQLSQSELAYSANPIICNDLYGC